MVGHPFMLLFLLCMAALAIAGIVLLTLGLRGTPIFSIPRCRKCSYDLRSMNLMSEKSGKCPECGANLASPHAVNFARLQRRPAVIVGGLLLLFFPLLFLLLLRTVSRRTMPVLSQQSTQAILAGLPTAKDRPWRWEELERRLRAGSLSAGETDKALSILTARLMKQRAAGAAPGLLSESESIVDQATKVGVATPTALTAVYQAFYGGAPNLLMSHAVHQDKAITVEIGLMPPSVIENTLFCWSLTSVRGDGQMLVVRDGNIYGAPVANPDYFSGRTAGILPGKMLLNQTLSPGEHELTFTFDLGVVPGGSTFHGLNGRPGTVDKWPHPIATWRRAVKRKIRVLKAGEALIKVVTDPKFNPVPGVTLRIDQAFTRPASHGVDIVIKWDLKVQPKLPLSYRIDVKAGGQTIDYGAFFWGTRDGGTAYSMTGHRTLKSLAPDIKSIDVLLTPDPKAAERRVGIDEICGRPLEFKNVPLKRFDFDAAQQ